MKADTAEPLLKLYAVQNLEGKFLHTKGYGDYGDIWTDSLVKAKIYFTPGPARGQITYFANNWPQYGIPLLVELHVTRMVGVAETTRVKKSQEQIAKKKLKRQEDHVTWEIKEAHRKISEANDTFKRLNTYEE